MDEKLIIKSKNGDVEAFTELILQIRNDLYKIAKTRLVNDADIDDAIQETMIEAYKSIKKLKNNEFFKTWIIKILVNKCNYIYKKKKKYIISYEENEMEKYISSEEISSDNIDFYLLIKNLKYEERIIIILFYMENYTTKEISKILKMNENTIKTRIARAKSKLKDILEGGKNNG